jgi:hypothetical protein
MSLEVVSAWLCIPIILATCIALAAPMQEAYRRREWVYAAVLFGVYLTLAGVFAVCILTIAGLIPEP